MFVSKLLAGLNKHFDIGSSKNNLDNQKGQQEKYVYFSH